MNKYEIDVNALKGKKLIATAKKAHSLCNNCPFNNECNFDCIVVQLDEKVWQLQSLLTEDEFKELEQNAEKELSA